MTPLHRKLFRDLLHMKGQATAIALVIASGVAVFVMSVSTWNALDLTRRTYYERFRFAEVFASLKRAPLPLVERIAAIPGVKQVEPRVVMEVTLDVVGLEEPGVGRLISVPTDGRPKLNDLHLKAGRYLEPERPGEVLASDAFCTSNGLTPGDSFEAVINGAQQRLTVVGIAMSPEYIVQMRGGDLVPDDKRFAIIWMDQRQLASAFDMEGAFNNVTLTLLRGASEQEVIVQLDRLIEPYGGVGAHGRDEQMSARFVSDEIKQLRGMAIISPSIFLSVAAFLLHVVLSRQISLQREQIAALKAFGYSHREVGAHYLQFVSLIVVSGSLIGMVAGIWFGRGLTNMYAMFYHFPMYIYRVDASVLVGAVGVSLAAAGVGTWNAVRKAVLLPPAEAMRPEPPAEFRETLLERLGWSRLFTAPGRMVLRELERRPWKAILSTLGISFATSVLVLGQFGVDAMDYLTEFQYSITQRQDVSVSFVEPLSADARFELQQLPGVLRSETYRTVPARIRHGHRFRRIAVQGVPEHRELQRLIDAKEQQAKLPPTGVMLSDKLAEVLGAGVGDVVTFEVLEGDRPTWHIPITATIAEFAGTNAYMAEPYLAGLLREAGSISGAHFRVDSNQQSKLYQQLKHTPRVAAVTVKDAALQGFNETIKENQLRMQGFIVFFACIIAFGVVYNTARVSLSERSREMGTLRVIGFTHAEVSFILLGELAILTLAAIPVGILFGMGFVWLSINSIDTETFRIPLYISRATMAFSAGVTILASVISGMVVQRKLARLELVAVLKQRE